MFTRSKIYLLLNVSILLSMILGACAQATPQPTEQTQPTQSLEVFKVGVLAPLSGPAARTGQELVNGAELAFEEINWTIDKYKIQFVYIDSQSDPAKAAQAYEQAVVQEGIQAGLLNWHSSVAVACMEVTAKYKIPHLLGTGSTHLVNEKFNSDPEKYGYWMTKSWPIPTKLSVMYVQALEDAIAKGIYKPENKTVAIYAEDTDLGRTVGSGFRQQFTDAGWTVVAEEYFSIDQTEFYPLLNKFLELNPAVVAGTSTAPPSLSAFIKQADEVGLKSVVIADGLGWVGEWYTLVGKSSDYVLDEIPTFATQKGLDFAKAFETRFGYKPSPGNGAIAYDAAKMWIEIAKEVIAETGSLSSEGIYNFVKSKVWTGEWTYKNGVIMKEYKWTPETVPDPVVGKDYYTFPVLQYFDGVGKIIFPPDWAEQEFKVKP